MIPQKILLVDDETSMSELICEGLQRDRDYGVQKGSNGSEAFEKYREFLPDIVLMDIEMPVMDGFEVSSKIKSFDPHARILVMTGNPWCDRARKTIEEGIALSLLEKPARLEDLNRRIRENLPPCA